MSWLSNFGSWVGETVTKPLDWAGKGVENFGAWVGLDDFGSYMLEDAQMKNFSSLVGYVAPGFNVIPNEIMKQDVLKQQQNLIDSQVVNNPVVDDGIILLILVVVIGGYYILKNKMI